MGFSSCHFLFRTCTVLLLTTLLSLSSFGAMAQICEPCGGTNPTFSLVGQFPIQPGCSGEVSFVTSFVNNNSCNVEYFLTLTFTTDDDPANPTQLIEYFNNLTYTGNIVMTSNTEGYGIYLEGEREGFAWANVNEPWTNMTFTNCATGVKGDIYPGKVENTTMTQVVSGISWQSSLDMSVQFRENRITARDYGIRSFINEPLRGGLGINKNTIQITGTSNPNRILAGVKADEGGYTIAGLNGWNILLNTVNMDRGGEGIGYRNGYKGKIANNPSILNNNRQFFYNGIRIDNSKFTDVATNSIGQVAGGTGLGVSNGIEFSGGFANSFSCNGFDQTNYGLTFRDMADFSQSVGGNCFGCHAAGMRIEGGAFIGEQYHTGNVWDLTKINTCGGGIGAINQGNPLFSRFFVDGFENPSFNPPVTPANWFSNDPTPEATVVCSGCALPRTTPRADSDKGLTALDASIATGQFTGILFPAEEAWKADYRLARKLLRHPEYANEAPVYAAFKAETEATSAGQLAYVSETHAGLFNLSATEVAASSNSGQTCWPKLPKFAAWTACGRPGPLWMVRRMPLC